MPQLCLLLSESLCYLDPKEVLKQSIAAGVSLVQIREKEKSVKECFLYAEPLIEICKEQNVSLVVNDSVELAIALKADGVHLGQSDMSIKLARKLLGDKAIIGQSTHNRGHVESAHKSGANYIGLGPLFPTKTKGYKEGMGIEKLESAAAGVNIPTFAIGGITPKNALLVPKRFGIAVSSAICSSPNPSEICSLLLDSRV